jgi:hypothetical protein
MVVDVTPALATQLIANRTEVSPGQSVYFTNTTTGGTGDRQYAYSVSPGAAGTDYSVTGNSVQFLTPGTYTVTLSVTDATGEVASSQNTVLVTQPLQITSFAINSVVPILVGQSVSFATTTTGGTGNNLLTYFVDGNVVAANANGSLTFPDQGLFTVAVGVTDATGEVANSIGVNVIVIPVPSTTGCGSTGNKNLLRINGNSNAGNYVITDQSEVVVNGNHNNVNIIMPSSSCDITIREIGDQNNVNVYNGIATLDVTGSSNVADLYNTFISSQKVIGSSDQITGGYIYGNTFTITGSNDLLEDVQVVSLNSLVITGSGIGLSISLLTSNPTAITMTGSSDVTYLYGGTASLDITGSYDTLYYQNTDITSNTLSSSTDQLIED